jgi:hypothetical protein
MERNMNYRKYIAGSLLLVTTALAPLPAISAYKWWLVTDLVQDGVSLCDGGGEWSYMVKWKPAINPAGNVPWPKYRVGANNGCQVITYSCTAVSCTATVHCSTKLSSSRTGVVADGLGSVSGVRVEHIFRPPTCK